MPIAKMLVGNSFGSCILRIARGEVSIERVLRIDACTSVPKSTDPKHPEWVALLNRYSESRWRGEAVQCIPVAEQLIREGKIACNLNARALGTIFWREANEVELRKAGLA